MSTPRVAEELLEKEYRQAWIAFASAAATGFLATGSSSLLPLPKEVAEYAAKTADELFEKYTERMG